MISGHPTTTCGLGAPLGPAGGPPVLVVDDDEGILEAVGSLLSHLGYTPMLAATGEEAMVKLHAGLEPVLVILDMDMPGLGGAGTLPLIRRLQPELPVVIATGRLSPTVVELTACYPKVTLMPKPYGLLQIKEKLS